MLKALLGRKMKMESSYDSHGRAIPVTKILVEPNVIVSLKSKEKEGYKAAEVGAGQRKKVGKALAGHFQKAGLEKVSLATKEIDFDGEVKEGQAVKVGDVFRKGSLVDVVGISKGKGFAGGMKRHGFHGGPKTHGQSDRHRAPGSIGSGTTPGRVFKGTKMAGHMGSDQVTVQGLQIVQVDEEQNLLIVKGSVPGSAGTSLLIKKSIKKPKAYHEPEIPAQPNLGGKEEEEAEKTDEATAESAAQEGATNDTGHETKSE
jgi:large subunit ribosomal protein L3